MAELDGRRDQARGGPEREPARPGRPRAAGARRGARPARVSARARWRRRPDHRDRGLCRRHRPRLGRARRPTRHNAPVFGPAGHAFVYFTYGHHWMLCVVTDGPGVPNVVLVRAAAVVEGREVVAARRGAASPRDWCRGPGRLTQALAVTGADSGVDLCGGAGGGAGGDAGGDALGLWRPVAEDRPAVVTGPRVGVRGPGGDGTAYPWRFWLEGEPTVSPYRRAAPRREARPRRGS